MPLRLLSLILFLSTLQLSAWAQRGPTLSGYVRDASTGEALIGATVYVEETQSGGATNVYGFYSFNLPPGSYSIRVSYLGYISLNQKIELNENKTLDLALQPDNVELVEVEVTAEEADRNVSAVEMSVNRMDMRTVKQLPQFMGEVDIVRSLQLLPGVSTVGEGASGFNVRGGNVDQNLILLDEATVYNSSHLFGFFSVFNADAVKDLTLYKGGIPARYGGRLSSVLDVRQKDGNNQNFSASGGIGLISSRLLLEGPLVKDKASFMVAGRRSYADIFLPVVAPDQAGNKLYFYDLNAKVNYTINDKNRIYLSGYFGQDAFTFSDQFRAGWGNATASLRWNHLFNPSLFSNFSAVFSNYNYYLGVPEGAQAFDWESNIRNYNLKADFTYFANVRNKVEFGGNAMYYRFNPGDARGLGDQSIFNEISVPQQNAVELAAYVDHEFKVSDAVTLKYGIRYSRFLNIGPTEGYLYDDENLSDETLSDTVQYSRGDVLADYGGLEPRLALTWRVNSSSSVKASYNLMRQYLHLVSNTTAATPLDVWTPAGKYVKPALAQQVAVGYFRNFKDNSWETSVEFYYKQTEDVLDYRNGAELLLNANLETELLSGDARSYGMELQISRVKGRLNGWVSYTLSRAEQRVIGVNNDEYYRSNWDKLHNLSIVGNYDLNPQWVFSAIFSYQSGRPFTTPDGRYSYEGNIVPSYSLRNNGSIPDYHRLDLSATYTPKKKTDGKVFFFFKRPAGAEHSWAFALYNAYGRRNAYSVYFRSVSDEEPTRTQAYQLSIFGSIIPSVTYNFKF